MKITRRGILYLLLIAATLLAATGPTLAADVPPVLDLNGEAPGIDFSATYTEDENARPIVSTTGLFIDNGEDDMLSEVEALLTNRPDGNAESLSANAGASGLTVDYSNATGKLTIKGNGSVEAYQTVLRTLAYLNTSQSPDVTDRKVQVTVSDGKMVSLPAVSTVAINAVNDAPVLNNAGPFTMTPINEDDQNSLGNTVAFIIQSPGGDAITDVDKNSLEGIAVIEAGSNNGVWQYSINAGNTWLAFPAAVSNTSAVLLNGDARIRFVPNSNYSGSANFLFRAWDQSAGLSNGSTGIDVSSNGGVTPFSVESAMVTISIQSVNDLPIVDLNGPLQAGTGHAAQFFVSGPPVPISTQDATIVDEDNPMLASLTITLTARPDDAAELLVVTDDPADSIAITPYNSSTGVLAMTGPDTLANFQKLLRQVTYTNSATSPNTAGRTVTVVANDGQQNGPVATTTISINPVNTAPVLSASTLSLGEVNEDTAQPAGAQIAAILAAAGDPITDADEGAQEGIAISEASATNGQWQYSLTNPPAEAANWLPVGTVSETAALILSDTAWLRYVPAPNYFGPSDPLTIRAWDRTTGSNGQRDVNVTINGENTAFSVNTATISASVLPVNDLPSIAGLPAVPLQYVEDAGPLSISEAVTVTDIDSPLLASATVRLVNPLDGDAEWLLVSTEGTAISSELDDGVLQLTGAASPAIYQQVLRSVQYLNASQDPNPADRVLEFSVADNHGASTPVSIIVQVQPVNDPPELDLNGIGTGENFTTTFYIGRGPVPIVAESLTVNDIDNTTIKRATIRITNLKNAQAELLSVDLTGVANISQSYVTTTGELILTGTDSIANYQRVLRTVTYDNILPSPDVTLRIVEFTVSDGLASSQVRQTLVSLAAPPTVRFYMPMVAWAFRRAEEPNNLCTEAIAVGLNVTETFAADDQNDWFFFDLTATSDITVELRDFTPREGQIVVAAEKNPGDGCGNLELVKSNGSDAVDKIVELGTQRPRRYYIWIINDGETGENIRYRLIVRTRPPA